jgi:uncharacterized delta-60 repeat protein
VALALLGSPAAGAGAPPGALDASFGSGGVVGTPAGAQLFGVAVAPSGEVIAVGQVGGSVLADRFSPGGSLENQYVGPSGAARAVVLQSDGKVVLAGTSNGSLLVERLNPNLTPDPSFGTGGLATAFAGTGAVANAVALAPDSRIVAAGSLNPPDTRVALARFTTDGRADLAEIPGFDHYSVVQGVAVQPDAKIILVGAQTPVQSTNGVIARLNPDGSQDSTFVNGSSHGAFTYHFPGSGYTALNAVALQTDGKIVISGVDAGGPNAIFLRLNPGGGFDTGFGSNGVAHLLSGADLSTNPGAVGAYGVGIAGGGRVIGAGMFEDTGASFSAALWALSSSGAPQAGFGNGGTVTSPSGTYEACALAVAPDGSLVSVGDTLTSFPHFNPCSVDGSAGGFVARYIGYGPAPTTPPVNPLAPTVVTGAASGVTETAAQVGGLVNPRGAATQFHFDYGLTASYGSSSPTTSAGGANSAGAVATVLRGLRPGTTYHYRLVATNGVGTARGADATFRTQPRLTAGLARFKHFYLSSTALPKGVPLGFSCSQPCSVSVTITISGSLARKLGLGHKRLTIARGSARLGHAGRGSIRLRFLHQYIQALLRFKQLSFSVSERLSPSSGGPTTGFTRTLNLRH